VNNAVKYSPVGTKIKVSLSGKDRMARIGVEDFGYGIPEKDKDKVFSRFYQNKDSNKKNISGLGLGLYIAKSIIKHHGGTLWFEPKQVGTVFYFTIPYYKHSLPRKK
jgi:signal transduction histidine kinase